MMSRILVALDPEMQRKAKRRAAEMGVSFAQYVRSLVAHDLGGKRKKGDASLVFDLGSSGPGADIARRKDAMIGEAVEAERSRPRRR